MGEGDSPKTVSPDAAALVGLADEALATCENLDTVTDRIVAYVEAFDRWYAVAKPVIDAGESAPLGGMEMLKRLEECHGEVIKRAAAVMEITDIEAKGLRRKGKGLVAYTDHLPKQLSTKRFRPG